MTRKATSRDVAELAGVSRSAVSLVLNGRGAGNVSPERQAAIRRAAKRLNYTPNSVAVSLRHQRTSTIGVVTDAIVSTAFGGKLLSGAADAALEEGFLLLVVDTQRDPAREAAAFSTLVGRQVDALMFAAMELRPFSAPQPMLAAPSVLANCFEPDGALTGVSCDEVEGGRTAAQILLDAGHRDIAMLSGNPGALAAARRVEGYLSAVAAARVPRRKPVTAGWEIKDGYAAAIRLLAAKDRPTGVVCANDRVATGVALAASRLGLEVPRDLSIVGYDDDENVAPCMVPPLTTIRLPHYEIGQEALRFLLRAIREGPPSEHRELTLPCPPVVRDSVGPPPSGTTG